MSSIPPICSAVHLPFGILPPAAPLFFRAPAAPPHPKTKKPVSAPAPSPPAALPPAAQAFPLLESGAKSGPSRGRGSRNGSCQAQPGISPRSAGTRRQLTSRCPSGMLLNEWVLFPTDPHDTLHGNMGVTGDFRFETLSDAKEKKTIFIACDAEILKYCTFRTTVPLLIFTVPPA